MQYFRCGHCGFVTTEPPYWLEEAYSEAIARSDIGLVDRNINDAPMVNTLVRLLFNWQARFLDYGGGYGLLVRMLRDYGLDFYLYDKYCPNIFARGYEGDLGGSQRYELITAFEVFEHMVNPMAELATMFRSSESVLFTTQTLPPSAPAPGQWWYYAEDDGQHIALYSLRSLRVMGERLGARLYSRGPYLHLLTTKPINGFLFRNAVRHSIAQMVSMALKGKMMKVHDDVRNG